MDQHEQDGTADDPADDPATDTTGVVDTTAPDASALEAPAPGTAVPAAAGEDYDLLMADAERVLDDVDRALARLADQTYGTCEACGAAIDDIRLTADPMARTCERHLQFAGPS